MNNIEMQIYTGFLAKMQSEGMTFHEVLHWWDRQGKATLFALANQLKELEGSEE